ncbi:kinetochore-associated protein 1 [Nilaparvata lugens]|uniref:kinetochore-associated protein 1 n=1 Tax=Nilaparvata lugens TaxID=108931 RepID=UPI00193E8486|nr:kinetochore-associated protein 1 [Nilaparvata lugens]
MINRYELLHKQLFVPIWSYDLIDRDSWLEKGISLAELMLDIVLKVEESDAAVGLENILIEKLSAFLTTLRQISCLKLVYHINITYKHFVEDNFNEVAFFLLTESPVDLISDLINDFLMQTLMVKKLDSDLVYSYCIERLLRSLPVGLVYPGAPWEIRAVKIIRAIYTAQVRLECVVSLLKSAAAPLSSFIMETVDEALALNHPLTAAIREQLQLVPSKMVLKKYEFNEIYNTDHMETIMNFIIHSNDENSFADSLIIAKTINMEDDVYLGFIIKFIEEGNHAKILEIMNKLEPEVLERIQTRLNLQANSMRDRMQFGDEESMKRLKRLRPYCSSMDQGLARSCQLELDFNIKSQVADLHSRKRIEELAHKAYKHLIQEYGRAEYIVQEASRLTEIFEIAHPYMILEVASMALHEENGELAVELLRYLVDSGSIDHKLCTKLLDFVGEHIFNLTKYMCNTSKPFEIASLLKTVSSMCLESASDITILQAVEISIWVNLITGCQPQVSFFSEDIPSTRLFQFLPEMVTSILKEYASFACAEGSRNRTVHRIFRNTVMPTSNLTVNDIASCVESAVNGLRQMEHNTVALQVVTDLYCCLSSNTKLATETPAGNRAPHVDIWLSSMDRVSWETLCNRCLSDILQKVSLKKVPCKHLNLTVGLAMLNVYTEEEAFCWLNNQLETHLYSANRTKAVAVLGAFYWKLKGNDNLHKKFMAFALKGQWGNKLSKLGLPYKDYINMDKQDVVMRLISMPSVGLDVLRDYCGVDFNDCLLNYMKQLVLSWEPAMTVSVDASGARVLHVKNTADGILMKMKSVSSLVDNHLKFMEFFAITLWKKVNCYYYELYIVLLDLFDHVSDLVSDKRIISKEQFPSMKHYRYILLFLINYRRMSPPSSQEEDMFFVDYNYLHTLPAISEFRLPFTYLVADKYTILKSELSLSTYKLWVSVSTLFCLNKSMLCSLAIYKMNLEKLATTTNKSKEEWCIHVCNEKLLEEIRECVSYIEDKEKACACLFFVVKNLPPGADQVTAANMCYEHTANWAAEDANIGSIAQQMLEKVHKKLLKVSTTHILYKYNLARREYLDLVLNPSMLINCLYHDPAILSKTDPKLVQVHCPDINNAVAEIEKAHQTNLASIKLELLEKWLVPDSNMDDSMISESNNIKSVAKLSEDDNLTRACYLLKNEDANFACNYLVSKAYTNEMQPLEVKLRALQCLINIITPQQIFEATGKDLNSIREYMKSLWFVYGMEQLGLNCSVKMFAARNKSELVAEILSQKSAASAILAAHICREYELHNPVYWNTILKLFTESSMVLVEHLEEFIFRLGIDWYLLDREILSSAWNRLIYLRFFQVDELSEDKDSQVDRIVENINICPSPDLLNKKFIKEQLMRLNSKHVILYK